MFAVAYIISQDLVHRHTIGARATDPVLPDRVPRRQRSSQNRSERRADRRQRGAVLASISR
jgi:hypothetical protein